MRALALLVVGLAACQSVPVAMSAAPAEGGVRVYFRRAKTGVDHPARLRADGGRLAEICHSPDHASVSALWSAPAGELRCEFPYGGTAAWPARREPRAGEVEYVFFEGDGVAVTARLPRACPMLPELALEVALAARHLPATLRRPGRPPLAVDRERVRVPFRLPADERGALRFGDAALTIVTRGNEAFEVLIGVDRDGTPAATTGYVRNWEEELD